MKKNNLSNSVHLLMLWKRYSRLVESENENIDLENALICEIEKLMPFKDQQEHEHWLDVSSSYKFWEDFEELTLNIINRKKEKKINMRFNYKKRTFELMELKEIGSKSTYDIVTIFEVIKTGGHESLNYVNYFYGVSENKSKLKSLSVPYIQAYFKQCQLNDLLNNLKKAYDNFKEDESTIESLDDAQYDLLDFVNENL